jgi:hypothetical protein
MKSLLIDDIREFGEHLPIPEGETITCKTFDLGIHYLTFKGPFDVLYLDHDLGEVGDFGSEVPVEVNGERYLPTGYGIMCYLEAHPEFKPGRIVIVSSNPVGRKKIQVVIDKLYRS